MNLFLLLCTDTRGLPPSHATHRPACGDPAFLPPSTRAHPAPNSGRDTHLLPLSCGPFEANMWRSLTEALGATLP